MNVSHEWRVAWAHAMALLKALKGKPEESQINGLVKALEKMKPLEGR